MDERIINKVGTVSGSIVVPMSFLKRHNLTPGKDSVRVYDEGDKVIIRPIH